MSWAVLLLCVILGSFAALRPANRKAEFRRSKDED
jgi:hypothetical protein